MLIRQAATELIREGFEIREDLWLPHGGFKLHDSAGGYGRLVISGPCIHKQDDHIVAGIFISTFADEFAWVTVRPFAELNESSQFLYADPAFPDNLLDFVSKSLTDWMCWQDVFKEESCGNHSQQN